MLSNNVVQNVAKKKTITCMIKVLSNMYEKPFANNKVFLMKRVFHLKMDEGDRVVTHVKEFNTIVKRLSLIAIEFDDEV